MGSEQGDTGPVLLDHKGLGRPPVFDGSRERFEAWCFSFESYCALLGWDGYVTTAVNLDPAGYPNGVPRADLGDKGDRVSRQIFHLLVQIVRGHALTHLRMCERGNGLEAIRRIYADYRTGLLEDNAALLQAIIMPAWWAGKPDHEFTDTLARWGCLIDRYEQASGERVSDNLRIATVLGNAPPRLRELLRTGSRSLRADYSALRRAIWELTVTVNSAERVNQSLNALFDDSQPTVPMDCSAINSKGGKGKGGGGKCAGKKGSCIYYGKTGHWAK